MKSIGSGKNRSYASVRIYKHAPDTSVLKNQEGKQKRFKRNGVLLNDCDSSITEQSI